VAFKLSKREAAQRDELARALAERADALRAKIEGYNDEMAERWRAVASAVEEYNGALTDARAFVEEVREGRQAEFDEKSERWQEGERGEAAATWLGEWEQPDLDDVEVAEPEPVEEPELEHAEVLENLPEAAE
jgi:hypothetical protein